MVPSAAPHVPSSSCRSCPALRAASLKKLGLRSGRWDYLIALAGNPNTGKSTLFNALTGLRQHTGNWPGKTVTRAEGRFSYDNRQYKLIDLPGTYSLLSTSPDEEVARNAILFGQPDVTVVVVDATSLERNLHLVLQVLEITHRVVVCLNLMDEARRHGIRIDERQLARDLGVPVVPTIARSGEGIPELLQTISQMAAGKLVGHARHHPFPMPPSLNQAVQHLTEALWQAFPGLPNARWIAMRLLEGDEQILAALHKGEIYSPDEVTFPPFDQGEQRDQPEANVVTQPPSPRPSAADPGGRGEQHPTPLSPAADPGVRREPARASIEHLLRLAHTLREHVGSSFHDAFVAAMYQEVSALVHRSVTREGEQPRPTLDRTIDRIVTSRIWGFPLMVVLFAMVFWVTISGANVPSRFLGMVLLDTIYPFLRDGAAALGFPWWLRGLLIDGVYLATAWVVSVMLPPMAIFFPLFTLLEDSGYLPRVAFNLDALFKRVGAHGKQALSMMMGFGCNAAGIVATRIIDSPRERLIAILTNNFALCNGRWPTQILMATLFLGSLVPAHLAGFIAAAGVVGVVSLGLLLTLGVSWILSRTILQGQASMFSLELPPYRPPRVLQTIATSFIDRTIIILGRAILFAMPSGAIIWLISHVSVGNVTVAEHLIAMLDPLGTLLGLNGIILLAYIVALPANEIVLPTVLMLTVLVTTGGEGNGGGILMEPASPSAIQDLLLAGHWTTLTGVNVMLFSLVHNPCSTTIYTIYKETGSIRWALVATILPLCLGGMLTCIVATVWRMFLS